MSSGQKQSAWNIIDRTAEPKKFLKYVAEQQSHALSRGTGRQKFERYGIQHGHRVLDVGCGIGHDVELLADLVGMHGIVIGVDRSSLLISEAKRRTRQTVCAPQFCIGDACDLAFGDNTFDFCWSARMFQHLSEPRRALSELIRVVRQGGRIAVSDADWGTLLVDAPNREVTRKILDWRCEAHSQPWIGRQLTALFRHEGLKDISTVAGTVTLTNFMLADQAWGLEDAASGAAAAGIVAPEQAEAWLQHLKEADREHMFLAAMCGFAVAGQKS